MDLDLDPTQTLLRDTVRDYLGKEVPFDRVRRLEREQGWDEALWQGLCEQGWLALPFPEALGGGGGGLVDAGILVEELARRAAIAPLAEVAACALALSRAGAAAAPALLGDVLSGAARPVPALAEADGGTGQPAARVAGGRLSGEKLFVDYGHCATHHVVSARDGEERGLFLVAAAAPGVSAQPLRTIGRTPAAAVRYEEAPAQRLAGAEALADLEQIGRALAAVQCLASAQCALDMTVAYARVREQFGRPIGSFQAVRHHCANMAIRVASARFLVYEALDALDRGGASPEQVAAAKACASRAAPEVAMLAHQIHGGNGVIEENDLYFFTLRGKDRSLAWGSSEECLALIGRSVERPQDWLF